MAGKLDRSRSLAGVTPLGGSVPVASDLSISPGEVAGSSKTPSDEQKLVETVNERSSRSNQAFRTLVERYQDRVFRLVSAIVRSKEEAQDITQEVFVKAYLALGEFKGQAAFFTWLYRIAHNMAIDYRRKVKRRGGEKDEYFDELNVGEAIGSAQVDRPDEALLRRQQAVRLREGFSQLSEEHREIMILREVDGLSYEEISGSMGVPVGTVMSRLYYARKQLQGILGDLAPDAVEIEQSKTGNKAK